MLFKYKAADASGKISESELEAESVSEVLHALAGRGLKPITITAAKTIKTKSVAVFGGKIAIKDQIFLTRYLALMLRVGMDIYSAINVLIANFDNPAIKHFLDDVKEHLSKGQPLYAAFAKYPQYFSPVFINLVKAGESSGTLEKVFQSLSYSLEREESLKNTIKSALFYPIILFVMAFLIMIFLVMFALPRISGVFEGGGFEPPTFSRIVFSLGHFLNQNAFVVFGGLGAIMVGAFLYIRTPAGKRTLYTIASHTPVVRTVVEKIAIQRFAATLSSLLNAGLPVLDALEISANVVGSPRYRDAIQRIAREGLAKGRTLGEAFQSEVAFPAVVSNLIAISEKAGHVAEILETLSHFYEEEVSNGIKRLVVFIEPMMLLGIGAVVGVIALSIIVPIYQLVRAF